MKRSFGPLLITLAIAATASAQQRVGFTPENLVLDAFRRPARAAAPAPAFAAAGRDGRYLVATSEVDGLFTAALDVNGAIAAGTRFKVPALTDDPVAQFPSVAFDGERFLVAWIEGTAVPRLLAMRFDRDGMPLEPVPQQIANGVLATGIGVAAGGGAFTVAYAGSSGARAARIASDGTVLERDRPGAPFIGNWRDVESNGTSALIANSTSIIGPCLIGLGCGPSGGRAITRLAFGTSAAATTVGGTTSATLSAALGTGAATDGQRYLVVSLILNTAIAQWGTLLRGELTDTNGERVVREFLIAKHQPPGGYPPETPVGRIDAVWTGGAYAIAYPQLNGTSTDLLLTFASPTGLALIDPVELANTSDDERTPVLLPLPDGKVLALYERGNFARPHIVSRIATLSIRTRAVR